MKKIVGTIAAIALAASSAFAGVGIGAWGRGIFAPVASNNEKDVRVLSLPSWAWGTDYQGPRVGISIAASAENVGFNIDMNGDNANIGAGDTQYIWVKPWDFLTLQVGKVQDNSARGDGCFGAFNWLRNSKMAGLGEDLTFYRMGKGTGSGSDQAYGAIVKVTPIEGLWIEAAFNMIHKNDSGAVDIRYADKAADVYSDAAQYGAGYDISGVGHIRAQYLGAEKRINAAFDLKAVEALTLTVGAFIPLDKDVNDKMNINAYAAYGFGAVKVHALVATELNKDSELALDAGLGADIDCGNGIGVNADVRFGTTTDNENSISFLVGATKSLASGLVGIGFQGVTQSADGAAGKGWAVADGANFGWAVPVRVEYWF